MIAKPGKITTQGACRMKSRPSASIEPKDGLGGCVPRPMNESEASIRIAIPMLIDACTTNGPILFGMTWRSMTRNGVAPMALAASTYSSPRVLITDQLGSYQAARRQMLRSVEHRQSKYLNNRAEVSRQPTRARERAIKKFSSPGSAQRFLAAFSGISPHFRPSSPPSACPGVPQ